MSATGKRLEKLERQMAPAMTTVTIYEHDGKTWDRWPWNPDARAIDADELARLRAEHVIFRVLFDADGGGQ